MLTQKRLKELLDYCPKTGVFTWRVSRAGSALAGTTAGTLQTGGYRQGRVDGKFYMFHRLAFFYVLGRWPKDQVDHVNGIRDDNRWANLREATASQNIHNRGASALSSSGVKGVYPRGTRWYAKICVKGNRQHLGVFDTIEEAAHAYSTAAETNFGEFAHNRRD